MTAFEETNMTTFAKCKIIRSFILRRAAEVMAYTSWSTEFAASEIRNIPKDLIRSCVGFEVDNLNPSDLTAEEMKDLDFGVWSKDKPFRLIPLWLLPFLTENLYVCDFKGVFSHVKKSELNNDNRCGCIAFGVLPKDWVREA